MFAGKPSNPRGRGTKTAQIIRGAAAGRRMVQTSTMADSSIFWLRVAAILYAIGLLHSLLSIIRRTHDFYGFALGSFRVGVVLHGVALVELASSEGRLPVESFY